MEARTESPALIARPRLLARLQHANVVIAEAPGGYGKSALAWAVAEARDALLVRVVVPSRTEARAATDEGVFLATTRRALSDAGVRHATLERASDVATLVAAIGGRLRAGGPALVLLVDDLHLAGPEAEALCAGLCGHFNDLAADGRHTLIFAGRSIPLRLRERLMPSARVVWLRAADLAFDAVETRAVLAAAGESDARESDAAESDEAETLRVALDGWPAAIAVALGIWGARAVWFARINSGRDTILDTLVPQMLNGIHDGDQRQAIAAAVQLPTLSSAVAEGHRPRNLGSDNRVRAAHRPRRSERADLVAGGRSSPRGAGSLGASPARSALDRRDRVRAGGVGCATRWTSSPQWGPSRSPA